METKVSDDGLDRSPLGVVWAIGQGRLKKFHVVRHASETERLIAENQGMVTFPWAGPIDLGKGEFEKTIQTQMLRSVVSQNLPEAGVEDHFVVRSQ